MKKLCVILVLCLGLTGCGTEEVFETLGQIQHEMDLAPAMSSVQLVLPESASQDVFSSEGNTMYDCGNYTLMLQTLSSGDLPRTVQSLSGFSLDKLTVMESKAGKYKRYEWVWTAAGEGNDALCRATVLDDGNYHYCLCAMTDAANMGKLQNEWNEVFASFTLS